MISTGPPDSILTWLAKHMRRVKLPDLLIEVDNQLGFTQNFLTSAQREEPSPEDIRAGRGHGARLQPRRLHDGAADLGRHLRPAQADRRLASDRGGAAERLGAIGKRNRGPRHLLTLGRRQDRGKRRTTVLAAASRSPADRTRFSDFALEFYTFVADNYAPFYSLPIECTDRDAAFVLDGLLYNESEYP
jgi:Tn3 transposase DDE domain